MPMRREYSDDIWNKLQAIFLFLMRGNKIPSKFRNLESKPITDMIRALGYEYVHLRETTSTQDVAKELLRRGYTKAIVRADIQLLGRGRFGRTWYSPEGGLWISILDCGKALYPNIIIPTAIVVFLRTFYKIDAMTKWPNDVYVYGKKLAGILVESLSSGSEVYYISGVGLNVNNDPPIEKAISLKQIIGNDVALDVILLGVILFYDLLKTLRDPLTVFKRLCVSLGKPILIRFIDNREAVGKLIDIYYDGTALFELDNGKKILVHASDVLHAYLSAPLNNSKSI